MTARLAAIEVGLLVLGISATVFLQAHPLLLGWRDVVAYMAQALTVAIACVVSFYYNDLYDLKRVRRFTDFSAKLVQSLGTSFILLAVFYSFFSELRLTDGPFLSSMLVVVGLVLPVRGIFYAVLKSRHFNDRVLLLGTGALACKVAKEIETTPHCGFSLIGFVDDDSPMPTGGFPSIVHPLVGRLEELEKTVEAFCPDRVIVAMAERRGRVPVHQLLDMRLKGIVIEGGDEVYERLSGKLAVESLVPSYLIFSQDFEKPRWQIGLHRIISLVAATIGLLLMWPLMGLIALLIRLDSRGPAFFVQERVGLRGRIFRLVKFRTMHLLPPGEPEPVWERDVESRITRAGKWLRKFRFDELPQFFNILRGDMDLIGPRPEMASNVKTMAEKIPYYLLRHMVRPGVTGWAQVKHGYSVNKEEVTEKIRYDLYYIKRMSVWLDLLILLDTVKIVLFGRGAK